MISVKTVRHIPTSRTIASFRSCPSALRGRRDWPGDQARIVGDQAQVIANEIRRQWLNLAHRSSAMTEGQLSDPNLD